MTQTNSSSNRPRSSGSASGNRSRRKKKSGNPVLGIVGKAFAFLGVTILALLIFCIIAIYSYERGPSDKARHEFVSSVHEMSAMKWVATMFLSKAEVEDILKTNSMATMEEGQTSNTEAIQIKVDETVDPIEFVDIKGDSFKGKMLIIHDPSRVFVGTVAEFGEFAGQNVSDMIDTLNSEGYSIVGGINGGDFLDMGSYSYTALPLGAVISEGEVVYAQSGQDEDTYYHLAGFTNEDKMILGVMSIPQAKELGVRDAIYCVHETGPFLIVDGEIQTNAVPNSATYGGGKNPRTAIGQREDGAVVMLVVDGRQASSLGATFVDLAKVMQEYGCINATAMDGGTSTQMVFEGEVLNHPYSPTGPRKCPTAWLIKNE